MCRMKNTLKPVLQWVDLIKTRIKLWGKTPAQFNAPDRLLYEVLSTMNNHHFIRLIHFRGAPSMAVCHGLQLILQEAFPLVPGVWQYNLQALKRRAEFECLGYRAITLPKFLTKEEQLEFIRKEVSVWLTEKGHTFKWHMS